MSYAMTDAGEDEMRADRKALERLNEDVDELSSDARDCDSLCPEAKMVLDLAWWFTEEAIRGATGACSVACTAGKFCACCHRYNELKPLAERMVRSL
jgi:hypothetical protein